jgi:hypothetical protein
MANKIIHGVFIGINKLIRRYVMLNKIKALFGFGTPASTPTEAPYKVELVPVVETVVSTQVAEPAPVAIEAVVATPVVAKKEKTPAKPKVVKAPKVAAMKAPAVKKPRAPKAK